MGENRSNAGGMEPKARGGKKGRRDGVELRRLRGREDASRRARRSGDARKREEVRESIRK